MIGHLDQLIGIHEKCRRLSAGSDASVVDDLKFERMELAALQAQTDYSGPDSIAERPQIGPEEYAERLPAEAEVTFRRLWKVEELLPEETAELLIKTSRLRGPLETIREQALELLAETPATAALDELLSVCRRVEMYWHREVRSRPRDRPRFYFLHQHDLRDHVRTGERRGSLLRRRRRYDRLVELFGGPAMPLRRMRLSLRCARGRLPARRLLARARALSSLPARRLRRNAPRGDPVRGATAGARAACRT